MKFKKLFALGFAACMVFAAGCNGAGATEYEYIRESGASNMLKFSSSDKSLDDFLNDYLHRHLRYDEKRIGGLPLGDSVMFNKEWEAMSLMYFDAETSVADDRYAMIRDWTSNVPVDKFGYTWSNKESLQPNLGQPTTYFGQGWPFPDYALSGGESAGWEWNDNDMDEGWTVQLNGKDVKPSVTSGLISVEHSKIHSVSYLSPESTYLVPKHAPFLEVDIRINDFKNVGAVSGRMQKARHGIKFHIKILLRTEKKSALRSISAFIFLCTCMKTGEDLLLEAIALAESE